MLGIKCVWKCKGCDRIQETHHLFHTSVSRSLLHEPYCACMQRDLIQSPESPDKSILLSVEQIDMTQETDPTEFIQRYKKVIKKVAGSSDEVDVLEGIIELMIEQPSGIFDNTPLRTAIYSKFGFGRNTSNKHINKLTRLGILKSERYGEKNTKKRFKLINEEDI